jgi:ABC-type sugar transport system permease subunit
LKLLVAARKRKDILTAVLFIAPSILVLAWIFVYPIYESLLWSFQHYHLLDGSPRRFIGLENYRQILTSSNFLSSIFHSVYFTAITVIPELIVGFFSALLLNEVFPGRAFFRTIIIIPWATLTLVNGLLWDWIYQPGFGALSVILHHLGLLAPNQQPVWLIDAWHVVNFAAIADVWKMTPFITLILLAGLQTIPTELYEAAVIDGAGFWRKIRSVTVPQLVPSIIIAVILRVMGAFRVYDILTVFTGDPTTSVTYLTFTNAFRYFHLGKASSMAWVTTIVMLFFIVAYIRVLKRRMDEGVS